MKTRPLTAIRSFEGDGRARRARSPDQGRRCHERHATSPYGRVRGGECDKCPVAGHVAQAARGVRAGSRRTGSAGRPARRRRRPTYAGDDARGPRSPSRAAVPVGGQRRDRLDAGRAGRPGRRAGPSRGAGPRRARRRSGGPRPARPLAAASRSTWQQVSCSPGCTSTSREASAVARSPVASGPGEGRRRGSRAASQSRCGPSPIDDRPDAGHLGQLGQPAYAVPACAGRRRSRPTTRCPLRERARDQRACSQASRSCGGEGGAVDAGRPTARRLGAELGEPLDHPARGDHHVVGAVADVATPVVGGDVEQRRLLGDERGDAEPGGVLEGAGADRAGECTRAPRSGSKASSASRTWRPGARAGAPAPPGCRGTSSARARARRGPPRGPCRGAGRPAPGPWSRRGGRPGATARTGRRSR